MPIIHKLIHLRIYFSLLRQTRLWCQELEKEYCNESSQKDQAGRHLRRSLAQPPAQSRLSWEIRPGCSELYPVNSWSHPRREIASALWSKLFLCLGVLMAGSYVLLKQSSPTTPHRASPPAPLIKWPSPELHPVYQYLCCAVTSLAAVSQMVKWVLHAKGLWLSSTADCSC